MRLWSRLRQWWENRGYVVISEDKYRYILTPCRTMKAASELASQYNDESMFGLDKWYSFYLPMKSLPSYLARREQQWSTRAE